MNIKTETSKQITASQLKDIKAELAKLKPVKVTLDDNRSLTIKKAIFALAPTLERMKKRGFDTQEIVEKLHEKGIEIKPPTLAKYLNEFRRGKEQKRDTPPTPVHSERIKHHSNWATPRCTVSCYGGMEMPRSLREELWDKYYTVAPARLRRSVEQSKIVKRA